MMTKTEESGRVDIGVTKKSLIFYRVMAYIVGVLLVVLVLVGMPLKYLFGDILSVPFLPSGGEPNESLGDQVVFLTGVPHGWLYAVLLIAAFNLKYRAKWGWGWFIKIALAGTVPFLSFVAEHFATKDVRKRIAAAEEKAERKQTRAQGATQSVRAPKPDAPEAP